MGKEAHLDLLVAGLHLNLQLVQLRLVVVLLLEQQVLRLQQTPQLLNQPATITGRSTCLKCRD